MLKKPRPQKDLATWDRFVDQMAELDKQAPPRELAEPDEKTPRKPTR